MKKLSHEDFLNRLEAIHGNKITVLGEYTGYMNKLLVRCNDCGREWEARPNHLLAGTGCRICNSKKSHEQFIEDVKRVHGNTVTILGEYKNSRSKILVKCNIHNHEWETTPSSFLQGRGCPECGLEKIANKLRKTHEQFVEDMKEVHGDGITVLGEYVDSNSQILVRCNTCGHEWSPEAEYLLNGHTCPECRHKKRQEDFLSRTKELFGDSITILSEYKNSTSKILVRCNNCGREWNVNPSLLLYYGHKCRKTIRR